MACACIYLNNHKYVVSDIRSQICCLIFSSVIPVLHICCSMRKYVGKLLKKSVAKNQTYVSNKTSFIFYLLYFLLEQDHNQNILMPFDLRYMWQVWSAVSVFQCYDMLCTLQRNKLFPDLRCPIPNPSMNFLPSDKFSLFW